MSPPSQAGSGAVTSSVTIRDATLDDLPRIVALLQELSLDEPRERSEGPLLDAYESAFHDIEASPRHRVLVADEEGHVVGTVTLMIVPNLSYRGRPWAYVDNVAVDEASRSKGIGEALMRYTVEEARRAGCYKVTLTSNKRRAEAHRFYRRLGFSASHEGFRISFDETHTPSAPTETRSR